MPANERQSQRSGALRPDIATLAGLLLACGAILGGLVLEGGNVTDITQVTALMIVLGGTIGAVMVTTPLSILIRAAKKLGAVFFERTHNPAEVIDEIISYASKARKDSIISLESELDKIHDPFMQKALTLAIDGTELREIRKMMDLDIVLAEKAAESCAKVYESAGGYAPTIGIIGAVLGLIQVMKHLENIEEVGRGIAVAFVATVYGVASANLFFLPVANKIKIRAQQTSEMKELMLEGVCSIAEGLNPKLIRMKLESFADAELHKGAQGAKAEPARKRATEAAAARG